MPTTIQISDKTKGILEKMKLFRRETYDNVIERLIEDDREINDKTKREIAEAQKRTDSGDFLTQEDVEKQFGL